MSAVVVGCLVAVVYGRVLDAPFIFDDEPTIVDNASIRRLAVPWGDADGPGWLRPPGRAATSRRPLPNLTLAVNYALDGLRPRGYHVVNVALHVATATVLAALVRRTLLLPYFAGAWSAAAGPVALAVALVWAVHPLVTEAVAYVTQRTEVLAALAFLATLLAAVRYWTAPTPRARRAWLAVATGVCLAGMLSKEIVATVPLAVALYERTFLVRSWRDLRRSWPLHAALASTWLVLIVLNAGGAPGLSDARHHVAPWVWWATQTKILLLYLKLAVWPWPLSIHYAPAYLATVADAWPWVAACAAVVAVIAALAWPRPAVRFVLVAALLTLAPTLAIPLPKMVAAERRMYLPLAGLATLAGVGLWRALAARGTPPARRARAGVAIGLAVVTAGALAAVTVRRLAAYASPIAIWTDAVAHQPDDAMAHYNLGVALVEAGRPAAETVPRFERALALDPAHTGALDNLGLVMLRARRYDEARRRFEQAIALAPDDGVARNDLGVLWLEQGRPGDALPQLERALRDEPELPKAVVHRNLGKALAAVGRVDEALGHFDEAARLAPDDVDVPNDRGATLLGLGRAPEAIPFLEDALRRAPANAAIENNLATALLQTGRLDEAIGHLEAILARQPQNLSARNNLGTALQMSGRGGEATAQFERVLADDPENATARYNLASALLDGGAPAAAVPHFEAVLRRRPDDAQARFKYALALAASGRADESVAAAETARTLAAQHGQTPLAADVARWLDAHGARPADPLSPLP